jgi:hypothetical protein
MRADWFRGLQKDGDLNASVFNSWWNYFQGWWNDHDSGARFWNRVRVDTGAVPSNEQLDLKANGLANLGFLCDGVDNVQIFFDTEFINGGLVARSTSAFRVTKGAGVMEIDGNTGLVSGNAWAAPTALVTLTPSVMTMALPIAMGANKITGLANGSASSDAAAFGQIPAHKAPTVQMFTTAGSGTYTTPTSPVPLFLRVKMVAGGGGGSGSGSGAAGSYGGNGGNGGETDFGTARIGGGSGGTASAGAAANNGGAGGGVITGMGTSILFITGGSGGASMNSGSITFSPGAWGGNTAYGGAGNPVAGGAGGAGVPFTGGGGAGGAMNNTGVYQGSGGGAGSYYEFFVANPTTSYSYTVGAAGSAGSAGTNGFAGGAGGSGAIYVEEYY